MGVVSFSLLFHCSSSSSRRFLRCFLACTNCSKFSRMDTPRTDRTSTNHVEPLSLNELSN